MSLFDDYISPGYFDEMLAADGQPHPYCRKLFQRLTDMNLQDYVGRTQLADLMLVNQGITFNVYGDSLGAEKPWPFDLIPRVIPANEWEHIERGLAQRLTALNLFLYDVYHEQKILKDRIVPRDLIVNAPHFRSVMLGATPPGGVYVHICGSDLIRSNDGTWFVLEDNLRTPSGVSYVLQNRTILTRVLPALFRDLAVRPVDHYVTQLLANLGELAPVGRQESPTIVILAPGVFNSAYFEHSFLAQQMGVELVEGQDLFVDENIVYMKTTRGPQRVDVIYRRVDDDFLDPLVFRADSTLGVPGLVNAYRAGNVALANAIGTGVADDKAVYAYMPSIIKYYLDQEPILPNVKTFLGSNPKELSYILENLDKLVVKATNESGGYGMLMGPQASVAERAEFGEKVRDNPRNYVAQPLISLSTSPAFVNDHFEPRHVDLRPFILSGRQGTTIIPGGLTRVALRQGSFVVNSSQGGGSKDTWVLAAEGGTRQSMSRGTMSQTLGTMTQSLGPLQEPKNDEKRGQGGQQQQSC
jgi:uncharacterized circularly permuted ATP-grasp superfamily protein